MRFSYNLDQPFQCTDLHNPASWDLAHVRSAPVRREYEQIVVRLLHAMKFMKIIGAEDALRPAVSVADIYSSHEGLLLDYESALTRQMSPGAVKELRTTCAAPDSTQSDDIADSSRPTNLNGYYNCSAHFLWIGDRTRQLDCAHVEYFSGLENPIGIKIGPSMRPDELAPLLTKLNPRKEIGKLTLITRLGTKNVESHLPKFIQEVRAAGQTVVWVCDPMHGK